MKTADEMRTIATRVQEYFLNGKTDAALYKMLDAKMKMDFATLDVMYAVGKAPIIEI